MMIIHVVNAFTLNGEGGNPAGIVILKDHMHKEKMQEIASELGYSETVFIAKENDKFRLKFFMPTEEIDLCGHATIAAYHFLYNKGHIDMGSHSALTNVGELEIKVEDDGLITMQQELPKFYGKIKDLDIYKSLGLSETDIPDQIDIEIVSTGVRDLLIPVNDESSLDSITPDFDLISLISKKYEVCGYHVYSRTNSEYDLEARNFAPLYGINEESATGTSNCALAALLFTKSGKDSYRILQGKLMAPSLITAEVSHEGNRIKEVFVGGYASIVDEKTLDF